MIKKYFLTKPQETLKQAMLKIKKNGSRTLVVLNKKKLLGTLSEGDIQKALLNNVSIKSSIDKFYNKKPKKVYLDKKKNTDFKKFLIAGQYGLIPIIKKNGELSDVITWADIFTKNKKFELKSIDVMVMAGGKGTRLKPLTEILPKPLIPINSKPMLEHILENFLLFNFKKFHLIINHQAELIESYFNSLQKNYKIKFIKEKKELGTAGGLSLLNKKNISTNFILSNCDTLFKIDYQKLYQTHISDKNKMTIVVSKKLYEFPYGDCKIKSNKLISIKEKPVHKFIANAGLYLINKEIIKTVKKNKFLDMNDLIKNCLRKKIKIGIFYINPKDWTDIGRLSDLKKINNDI